jgi:hypothetical protein
MVAVNEYNSMRLPVSTYKSAHLLVDFVQGCVARHCNYLGDILVAFSFNLPCFMRYTTLSMPECWTITDQWFFCRPPAKFQYSGKIEKLQLVGDFVKFSATKSYAGGY